MADAIEKAWRSGARFDAWSERFELERWSRAFEECGIDALAIATRQTDKDAVLPWAHISTGVSIEYLWSEREKALAAATTPDCSFDGCTGCDACDDLGVQIVLGGDIRGSR